MISGGGSGQYGLRILRSFFLLTLALGVLAGPLEARRYRRTVRRPTAQKIAARPVAPPAIASVPSVILMVAYGYTAADWGAARKASPTGCLSIDSIPVTGVALPPSGADFDPQRTALWLSTGLEAPNETTPTTLMSLARRTGRSTAIVSGGEISDPLPAYIAVPPAEEEGIETVRRLVSAQVDAMFARATPDGLSPGPEAFGYHMAGDAKDVLMMEATPAFAIAVPEQMPFDALAFRALHLAARNTRGFVLALGARPATVPAADFDAAVAAMRSFTRRSGRTLMLLVLCPESGPFSVYADGNAAVKFSGTVMATDIPKIIAGVTGVKDFPRTFSPLYTPRLAENNKITARKGIIPLPW